MFADENLPLIFAGLMGLSVLVYAILDGYDLGVGILLPFKNTAVCEQQRDEMIASIGPFWDANETWLVLAIGIMLIAFPVAHSMLFKALYIPTALMLIGLILRGVAFDFRAKVAQGRKQNWDKAFKAGSLLTSLCQGYMLGMYVMGFEQSTSAYAFAGLSAIGVSMAYALIGAAWLIMKTDEQLQINAVRWSKKAGAMCLVGIIAVCVVNPLINSDVQNRWFEVPWLYFLGLIPALCFGFFFIGYRSLMQLPNPSDQHCWLPFAMTTGIFLLCFSGLAVSFYPYVIPGQLTFAEAASAPASLRFILYGALIVIPCILAYTMFSYRVFWGKVQDLRYY